MSYFPPVASDTPAPSHLSFHSSSSSSSSHIYPTITIITMASHEQEDTMPEETQGYKLSQPKQSLAEYQKMGKSLTVY